MMTNIRFRNLAVWVVLALFLLNSCSNENSVSIKGTIASSKDSKIVLEKLGFSKSIEIDSIKVFKGNDKFRFKVKNIFEPTFFVLKVEGKGSITILSEPGENVQLAIKNENFNDYSVVGSKGSLLTQTLSKKISNTNRVLDSLIIKYELAQDSDLKAKIEQEYSAVVDSQRAFSSRFIWANPMSRASVMALYQKYSDNSYVFDNSSDIILFKTVASSLKAFYPESEYAKGMITDIKRMESIVSSYNIKSILKQAQTSLPEIALPNMKGDTIKLSSLKGKVVLLDFWASFDQTSIMDNRELLEIYRQNKSKGFEIYQVSLDSNRDDWVTSIESASLPWISVSELNPKGSYYARIYNVTQIPANYLIDRNHTIIGKNLYGEELKKKLREVL
ncbi:MAG: thioredoxin-like domain-containing protein [Tenuifilaceae bacterium]